MLRRLFLLRHANAALAAPGMADFDRPLDRRGHADAREVGVAMAARGYLPALVLCSAARRAHETWTGVAAGLGTEAADLRLEPALYNTDARGYIEAIRAAGDEAGSLLLIGHNPTMEHTACLLAPDGETRLDNGFPTAGLAVFAFDVPLSGIGPGAGTLEAFLRPGR